MQISNHIIITYRKSKTISIYWNPGLIHILLGLNPNITIADLVRDIKSGSSKWINKKNLVVGKFAWQVGYRAFTYSKSQIDLVCKDILNQPIHHKNIKFKDEYVTFLDKFAVDYDEKYVFD